MNSEHRQLPEGFLQQLLARLELSHSEYKIIVNNSNGRVANTRNFCYQEMKLPFDPEYFVSRSVTGRFRYTAGHICTNTSVLQFSYGTHNDLFIANDLPD